MARDVVALAQKRFAARKMLKELAAERKVAMRDIVGRYNEPQFVALRVEFIKRASALGLGCISIGRIVERSPWTVQYHLKPEMRARKQAQRLRWRAKRDREAQHAG